MARSQAHSLTGIHDYVPLIIGKTLANWMGSDKIDRGENWERMPPGESQAKAFKYGLAARPFSV